MAYQRILTLALVSLAFFIGATTEASAQTLYKGSWIAESFGNDKVGGTDASEFFSIYAAPQGNICNGVNPVCPFASTPVAYTTTGPGTMKEFNPLGPLCTPLTAARPAKGGTATNVGACKKAPCSRIPPLFRDPAHFTGGGLPMNTACGGNVTVSGGPANTYLPPGHTKRGAVMKGAPVQGSGYANLTGQTLFGFNFPAAPVTTTINSKAGMRRTTTGSFDNVPPYLYSYSYATMRNDNGVFGPGQGFFGVGAAQATVNFKNKAGGATVASAKVNRGKINSFGGVMRLLGQLNTKVCYFYAGGCALGYGSWKYEDIGAAGAKNFPLGTVTMSSTTSFTFSYYNTALETNAKYTVIPQRFPWTTGTVTVTATGRGPHKTFHVRKGSRKAGAPTVQTVQLVSPILTQWLGSTPAVQFETGGIAVMNIQFVPEPGVIVGLVAGISLLGVLYRRRS